MTLRQNQLNKRLHLGIEAAKSAGKILKLYANKINKLKIKKIYRETFIVK